MEPGGMSLQKQSLSTVSRDNASHWALHGPLYKIGGGNAIVKDIQWFGDLLQPGNR